MTDTRIGRRIYAAAGIFLSTLVIGTATDSTLVEAADPPIEIVGLSTPKTLGQVHDGVEFVDEDDAGNMYFGGGANLAGWVWKATPSGVVTRFAGSGSAGFAGDGGPALGADIPAFGIRLEVGGNNNVYLAGGERIRRIDSAGNISTVAGDGTFGAASGDGGTATSATLGGVRDFAVDGAGNVYVATNAGLLRKVTAATGIISTLFEPDADFTNRDCAALPGLIGSTDLGAVSGVTVADDDDVIVIVSCSDGNGVRIVEIDTPTNTASVVAGGGAGVEDSGGIATDVLINNPSLIHAGPGGTVSYLSRTSPTFMPANVSVIRTVNSAGMLSNGALDIGSVRDFVPRSGGTYLVGTNFDNRGALATASGSSRTFLTADGDPADGVDPTTRQVSGLSGLAVDADGVVYYSTTTAPVVRSLTTAGVLDTFIGNGTIAVPSYGSAPTASPFSVVSQLEVADNGDFYASAATDIARIGADGLLAEAYSSAGTNPRMRAFTSLDSTLYVGGVRFQPFPTPPEYSVSEIDGGGNIVDTDVVTLATDFATIVDLASTPDDHILVAPSTGLALLKLNPTTGLTTPVPVPDGVQGQSGLVVDPAGTIFFVDARGLMMIPTSGAATVVDPTPYREVDIDDGGNVYVNRYGTIVKFTGLGAASTAGDVMIGDDTGTAVSGEAVTIAVSANDSTTVGALGPVKIVGQPANGTATAASATAVGYVSDAGFGGTDTFRYQRCSTTSPLICGVGTVTVTVTGGSSGGGSLITVEPARLYDTRPAPNVTSDTLQQQTGRRTPGTVTEVQVAGRGNVPADASAAILNVTAIRPSAGGFFTVYPCGADRPDASTLNAGPGDVVANNVTVKIGTDGKVCVFNLRESNLVVDVTGYAPSGSSFGTVVPARLYDSRPAPNVTVDNEQQRDGRRPAGTETEIQVAGRGNIPADAEAVALNTTIIRPSQVGFATVYPCGGDRPLASTLNYAAGDVVPNGAIVKLGDGGKICVFNLRATDLVVDVTGFAPAGTDIVSIVPARLFESRAGEETVDGQQQAAGRRTAGQTTEVQITGRNGIPDGASTAILNVTAIRPSAGGFVTVYPCGVDQPGSSTLNAGAGEVVANGTVVQIGTGGTVCVFTLQPMNLVVDITGYLP
ncbi:MAG: hypothetical protein AB8G14_15940 [Ilumatobacter sp.]